MNTETFSGKSKQAKAFIVIVFFAVVSLIAWLSVQIVAYTPNAFSSLASLAQGINQYREAVMDNDSLTITSGLTAIESTKPATITWKKDSRPGTYTFSYSCIDGATVELVSPEGMRTVSCDMRYSLGDTDTVTVVVDSKKSEPVNLSYAISFMRENDIGPIRIGEQTLSVTPNTTLAEATPKEGEVLGETDSATSTVATSSSTKKPTSSTPTVATQKEPELIYKIPVSNPNGFTDLQTKFIASGSIAGNKFVAGVIEQNNTGAIQFEVKNIGTKTSESWTYSVTLPDGDVYTSPKQTALKPNERATISLGFNTSDAASHTFVIQVAIDDRNNSNDKVRQAVTFKK